MVNQAGEGKPVKYSTMGSDGCRISCLCGNSFTVTDLHKEAECPECKHVFYPGFAAKAIVVGRRSGMPVGTLAVAEKAASPKEAAEKAAARVYTESELAGMFCQVESSEPAFFAGDPSKDGR